MILTLEQVFEAKRQARRRFDAMSFEEKIGIVERMRDDLEPLRRLREARHPAAAFEETKQSVADNFAPRD